MEWNGMRIVYTSIWNSSRMVGSDSAWHVASVNDKTSYTYSTLLCVVRLVWSWGVIEPCMYVHTWSYMYACTHAHTHNNVHVHVHTCTHNMHALTYPLTHTLYPQPDEGYRTGMCGNNLGGVYTNGDLSAGLGFITVAG